MKYVSKIYLETLRPLSKNLIDCDVRLCGATSDIADSRCLQKPPSYTNTRVKSSVVKSLFFCKYLILSVTYKPANLKFLNAHSVTIVCCIWLMFLETLDAISLNNASVPIFQFSNCSQRLFNSLHAIGDHSR